MTVQRGRDGFGEPPYTGALGSTRRETALIPSPDGTHRRVEILKSVNVVTDPALGRQAIDGTLHRYGDVELAVPFVYHDPASRRFVLVVPPGRAHEELQLRADLLLRLSADTAELVPSYVREGRSVIGFGGLRKLIEEPASRTSVVPSAIESIQREERHTRRAQELSLKEMAIEARAEEIEAVQKDLSIRETELEQRVAEIIAREEVLAQEEQVMRANMAALSSREKRLQALDEELTRRETTVRELLVGAPPATHTTIVEPLSDDAMELEPEEQTGRLRTVGPAPEHTLEASTEFSAETEGDELRPDEVALIDEAKRDFDTTALWAPNDGRSWVAVVEGEVRLWTQGSPETVHDITAATTIPMLQCDPDGVLPVALLSVRAEVGRIVTRVGIDFSRPEDRAVLDALTHDFRVRIEVMSPAGRAIGSQVIGAPCEENARRVLDLLCQRPPSTVQDRQSALALLVTEGLKWSGYDDFLPDSAFDSEFETAETVERLLARYEPFLENDQADRFAVASGRSSTQIEALGKRLTLAALRCGSTLSPKMVEHALKLGIAQDERMLALRALMAFTRTVEGGLAAVGRTPLQASKAWRPLLAWAERAGVIPNDPIRIAVASVYNPDEPESLPPPENRTSPSAEQLASLSTAALVEWVDHSVVGLEATRLLILRDLKAHSAVIVQALRTMPLQYASVISAEILRAGDSGGDLWIEMLSSPRRTISALGAVGSAALKLRRALNLLIQKTLSRDEEEWRLFGWAAGEFGPALVRALGRLDDAPVDRLAWMLGHSVRAGGAREVDRIRPTLHGVVAEASSRCLSMQDAVKSYDISLRKGNSSTLIERSCSILFSLPNG